MVKYIQKGQKESILKWRAGNKEKYNEYMNDYHKEYYKIHADLFRKKRRELYYYQQECKRLRNIDILEIAE